MENRRGFYCEELCVFAFLVTKRSMNTIHPNIFTHMSWEFFTMNPPVDELIKRISVTGQYDVYLNISDGSDEDDAGIHARESS